MRPLLQLASINLLVFVGLVATFEIVATIAFAFKDTEDLRLAQDTIDSPYVYFSFRAQTDPHHPVNADGMATTYPLEKAAGSYRVAVLGGSTARSSFATDKTTTIAGVLERLLRERFPGKQIEVINAGMSGYVLEQEFIFYQLSLSKYRPDLVIGLDGYNDLMAVSLNRRNGSLIGPQNYLQFQVIQDGKTRGTWVGRLSALIPNSVRVVQYIRRVLSGRENYDYSFLDESYVQKAAARYSELISDLHGFVEQRGATYVAFLQPIRWYDPLEPMKPAGAIPELVKLYQAYEQVMHSFPRAYLLTGLLRGKEELYVDSAVHVGDQGNELFARAILERIIPFVEATIDRIESRKGSSQG
ncbi:MAG: SGNH/GDSL hydrolase family protein [Desulfobacteraceae bacterium]|nr:MAG: SGNH/GDSL hydrolase family protein [Desulfobacteraceae bacterium]